jgi:hypothetical protein
METKTPMMNERIVRRGTGESLSVCRGRPSSEAVAALARVGLREWRYLLIVIAVIKMRTG